jgi:hypothetical protein
MSQIKYLVSFLLFVLLSTGLFAQTDMSGDRVAVHEILVTMFDGMREGDSAKVASVFRRDVRMFSAYKNKSGESVLREDELFGFLKAVGTPHPEIWDERIYNTTIKIDGAIAQVWTNYSFYVGEKFSHCGVDAFQLIRKDNLWKIISLMDTRRKESCE